jgi:hypothetical protein
MSDFRPCRECKDWDICLLTESEKDWFGYKDIRYCPQQIFWLLKYRELIMGHRWPVAPDAAPGGPSSTLLSDAVFVSVSTVLAELDTRLSKTGWRGKLLAEECINRDKMLYLSDEAKHALYYVAIGKGRKFSDWLKDRQHYRKHRPKFQPKYRNDLGLDKLK